MNAMRAAKGRSATRAQRGRPPKTKVDFFREQVLRTVIGRLPSEDRRCKNERSAVLNGGALSLERQQRIAEQFPSVAEAIRWPFQLLETKALSRTRMMRLIETYDCGLSYKLEYRRVELPASTDGHEIFFPEAGPDSLLRRGDLYGYLALLTQFRLSGLQQDVATQWTTARYLARSLAGACLHPSILPHARRLITLTMRALRLLPHPCVPVKIDRHKVAALVRARTPYVERATCDPLIHHLLQPCDPEQATLLISYADLF